MKKKKKKDTSQKERNDRFKQAQRVRAKAPLMPSIDIAALLNEDRK